MGEILQEKTQDDKFVILNEGEESRGSWKAWFIM
jgi:hypothetical protein